MRDVEAKVRFSGYDPVAYKLFVWTLSAVLCGFAGALYVPQVGIVNPSEMQPSSSVEIAVWVAVGGRGTLGGAALGALLVNGAKSWLTAAFPAAWLYVLGVLFVSVTLLLPGGVYGALSSARRAWKALASRGRGIAIKREALESARSPEPPIVHDEPAAPEATRT
jgi:urea transport system permease protein